MKIGLVLAQPPGYSETFFNSKIKGLQQYGCQVTLFCQTNAKHFSWCEVKPFPGKSKNPFILILSFLKVFISLIPYLARVLKWYRLEKNKGIIEFITKVYLNAPLLKADLDWLHFGFGTMALGRESIAQLIGAKMAVSFRGYDINVYPKKYPNCYSKVWNNVDKIHSISNYLIKEARFLGLKKDTPLDIITPAVDMEKIKIVKNNEQEKVKIVTIARLNWIKGIDFLIEAAAYLRQRHVDFEWLVIGDGKIQDKERYLYHVYEKDLIDQVYFLGKKTHKETLEILMDSQIYVQTSYNEGFCNAMLEAQAFGKLCLAFNSGALSENILDKKTGWLVAPFDSEKLAKKIIEVSQLSEEKKQHIQTTAINRIREEFTLEKQQKEFMDFYSN